MLPPLPRASQFTCEATLCQVKKFELVEVDAADPSLMTPTQKLKRALFAQRWSSAVERMYC